MIFQHTWQQVVSGQKSQTRRLAQEGDTVIFDFDLTSIWAVYRKGRLLYKVGQTRAVQPGRSKAGVGRIRLTGIRREPVNEISKADAIAEGLYSFTSNLGHPLSNPVRLYHANLDDEGGYISPIEAYENLWNQIHPKAPFETGPVVWVLTFKQAESEAAAPA
jgi:hypothetical protein